MVSTLRHARRRSDEVRHLGIVRSRKTLSARILRLTCPSTSIRTRMVAVVLETSPLLGTPRLYFGCCISRLSTTVSGCSTVRLVTGLALDRDFGIAMVEEHASVVSKIVNGLEGRLVFGNGLFVVAVELDVDTLVVTIPSLVVA